MKKYLLLLAALLVLSAPLLAQTLTPCSSSLPTWIQCDNTHEVLYVNGIAVTGGTKLSAGLYVNSFDDSGNLTFSPYTPAQNGSPGPAGPANVLSIGEVSTGAPGSQAEASITGVSPTQQLNLVIPQGAQGPPGSGSSTLPFGYQQAFASVSLNPSQRACQSYVIRSAITANHVLPVISPEVYPGDAFSWVALVAATDTINICVRNESAVVAVVPATTFLLRLY